METGNNQGAMLEMSIALRNITSVLDLLLDGDLQLEADQLRKGLETVRGYTKLTSDRLDELSRDRVCIAAGTSVQRALLAQTSMKSEKNQLTHDAR